MDDDLVENEENLDENEKNNEDAVDVEENQEDEPPVVEETVENDLNEETNDEENENNVEKNDVPDQKEAIVDVPAEGEENTDIEGNVFIDENAKQSDEMAEEENVISGENEGQEDGEVTGSPRAVDTENPDEATLQEDKEGEGAEGESEEKEASDEITNVEAAEHGDDDTTAVESTDATTDEDSEAKSPQHDPTQMTHQLETFHEEDDEGVDYTDAQAEHGMDDYGDGDEEQEDDDDEEEEVDDHIEEEEEEELAFDREAILENYRLALLEKKQIQDQNNSLQTKLAEYFRKKKSDAETGAKVDIEKSSEEHRQRYEKYMATLNDMRRQRQDLQEDYQSEIENLQSQCIEKQSQVDKDCARLLAYKREIALKSMNSRTGRQMDARELDEALENEHKKETEVVTVRLESIKLQNQLKKEEHALKSREELAEGLHLIDFEQLKIENQTYNEKIEERNEELLKLRKKIESTVQILTHVKEKLQFVQQENQTHKEKQQEVDVLLKTKRDQLTRIKQRRDALRRDTQKLKQNCGLLGNDALLRNFEECVDIVEEKKDKLEHMRREHAELSLRTKGYAKKISVARSDKETRQLT